MATGPLAGIRVVDFGLYLPGPYATRLLADLGADVVKVEPPAGDPVTRFLPAVYGFLNRGKQVVALDLKQAGDLEAAHDLVHCADVLVEGFRPGVAERLGIGFEACAALRPGLVYASLSGYGQTGPDRDRPGHDIGYEASGGAFAAGLVAGDALAAPHVPVADLGGALFAATTICAHLAGPRTDAVHLDVALQEVATHLSVSRWGGALRDGASLRLEDLGSFAPGTGLFRTRDGRWVALASVEDRFWVGLCAALGMAELARPPYDGHTGRMDHRAMLRERLARRIAELEVSELAEALREHDVPFDPVRDVDEVLADVHLSERGMFRGTEDGVHVDYPVVQNGRRSFARDAPPAPLQGAPA